MTAAPRRLVAFVAVAAALTSVSAAPPALADDAASRGLVYRCLLETTKVGGEITVTLRLRTNGPRDGWRLRLFHGGELVFKAIRRTNGVGNLRVTRGEPNLPGRDGFVAKARHLGSGTLCTVDATI
jgi:hypothetical protein